MNDPRLDPVLRRLIEENEGPGLETMTVDQARQTACDRPLEWRGELEPVAHIVTRKFPGVGAGDIAVRIYTPEGKAPRPGLVYFHGGGWVVCDLDTHDHVCRMIANRADAVVVSVDYRRAPEHKFPAAVEDCYSATKWVAAHANELGIDADRLAVGGDSAGGNLATVVSFMSREQKGPSIALQVLVYPVTDLSSMQTGSYREFAAGYFLSAAEMEWFRGHYLRSEEDARNPHASPLLAEDLHGLPPALVITAECDVLRDEAEEYARRLQDAGVAVELTRYSGMVHPFFSMPGVLRQAGAAVEQIARAMRNLG